MGVFSGDKTGFVRLTYILYAAAIPNFTTAIKCINNNTHESTPQCAIIIYLLHAVK